jgi:hypothetical protein
MCTRMRCMHIHESVCVVHRSSQGACYVSARAITHISNSRHAVCVCVCAQRTRLPAGRSHARFLVTFRRPAPREKRCQGAQSRTSVCCVCVFLVQIYLLVCERLGAECGGLLKYARLGICIGTREHVHVFLCDIVTHTHKYIHTYTQTYIPTQPHTHTHTHTQFDLDHVLTLPHS